MLPALAHSWNAVEGAGAGVFCFTLQCIKWRDRDQFVPHPLHTCTGSRLQIKVYMPVTGGGLGCLKCFVATYVITKDKVLLQLNQTNLNDVHDVYSYFGMLPTIDLQHSDSSNSLHNALYIVDHLTLVQQTAVNCNS